MRSWLRILLTVLGLLLLLLLAYSPLLRAGLLAPDYRVLVEASRSGAVHAAETLAEPEPAAAPASSETQEPAPAASEPAAHAAYLPEATSHPPLTDLSLRLSSRLSGVAREGSSANGAALYVRAENLVLLLAAAVGLGFFARRLLLPWTGSNHAAAAAWSAGLLFALHPLCTATVAGASSRGELLGLLLGVWSGAAFLRGRQDRRIHFTAISFVLCGLGGFTSDLILGLPLLLAGSEFLSAHRYRSMRGRLRTTATTLMVFGAAASLDLMLHVSRLGADALPPGLLALGDVSSSSGLANQLTRAAEKLGLLVLPSNPFVLGVAGTAVAGAAFLLAMHPALVAARAAPRLWGWLLFGFFAALAATGLLHAHVSVAPLEFSSAKVLLPSAAVMAVGIGLGCTALSGARRVLLPWVIACVYASLAHGNARPWHAAALGVEELRADLIDAREFFGRDVRMIVLDPPSSVAGIRPLEDALPWLLHPALDERSTENEEEATPPNQLPDVRSMSTQAFLALVREPEFDRLRAEPLVVLCPVERSEPSEGEGGEAVERRRALFVEPTFEAEPIPSWRVDLNSPRLDLDALETGCLTVTAPPGTDLASLSDVSWSAWLGGDQNRGAHGGVWVDGGGEPLGIFDLSGSLDWRLSGRVRQMWFETGRSEIFDARLSDELPVLSDGLEPEDSGSDWTFPRPEGGLVARTSGRGQFVVGLLDLVGFVYEEHRALPGDPGQLVVVDAADRVEAIVRRTGGAVAWVLEYRVDGRAVARNHGRRIGVE